MPPLLPEGSKLRSRYQISRLLNTSRVRNIYVAEDLHLRGHMWVVKQMLPVGVEATWTGSLKQRFEAESRLVSSLEHPNLPKLLDFFIEDTYLYIVREYVPGQDLATIVAQRGGVLPEQDSLKIGIQLTGLMNYLLKKKLSPVIFRGLSLGNLILAPDGKLKLIDFGFSRLFQHETRMGPPDYSAPEQYSGEEEVDSRTLVYNVGALVYHLLSGQNPGHSPFNLTPLEELNAKISVGTCKAINKALQNEKKRRPAHLGELKRLLQSALENPGKPPKKKRKPPKKAGKTGTIAVFNPKQQHSQSVNSPITAWLVGTLLTLVMGGGLLAVYQIFLKPMRGF